MTGQRLERKGRGGDGRFQLSDKACNVIVRADKKQLAGTAYSESREGKGSGRRKKKIERSISS